MFCWRIIVIYMNMYFLFSNMFRKSLLSYFYIQWLKSRNKFLHFEYRGETPDCAQNVIVDIWVFKLISTIFFSIFTFIDEIQTMALEKIIWICIYINKATSPQLSAVHKLGSASLPGKIYFNISIFDMLNESCVWWFS